MQLPDEGVAKPCVICGVDCSHRPRTKDRQGRYYCRPCYEQTLRKVRTQAAQGRPGPALSAMAPSGRGATLPAARQPRSAPKDALDELAALESAGTPLDTTARPCPSCGCSLAVGAVFCTACGYDLRARRKVAVAGDAAPSAKAKAGPGELGNVTGLLANPLVLTLGLAAVILLFFLLARSNPTLAPVYTIVAGVYQLSIGIWILVTAFRESLGTGFMCLCIPFYALYFVLAKSENPYLKGAFAVSILGSALWYFLPSEGLG